jgi:hypothetical protein
LGADEKGDGEYRQPPSAADMTFFIDEKVMRFHLDRRILASCRPLAAEMIGPQITQIPQNGTRGHQESGVLNFRQPDSII